MLHLSRKCGESVPGGRYDDATCHGNAGKVCQVDGAIAGLELPDRNITYLNLPDRKIADVKFPDRAIAGVELPTENCWPRHPGPIITDGTGPEGGEWCRCLKH